MSKGFTLIEMIVSIAIISGVTALFIANYHSAGKRSDLVMTAQEVVADLHAAQSNTLGLTKYNTLVPPGGWGINFDRIANSYTLFADLNAPGTSGYREYDSGTEGDGSYGARHIQLPDTIQIYQIKTANNQTYDLANVTFLPPDPRTNIWVSGGATSTALEIQLIETGADKVKTIKINFLGLAEVSD